MDICSVDWWSITFMLPPGGILSACAQTCPGRGGRARRTRSDYTCYRRKGSCYARKENAGGSAPSARKPGIPCGMDCNGSQYQLAIQKRFIDRSTKSRSDLPTGFTQRKQFQRGDFPSTAFRRRFVRKYFGTLVLLAH